MNGHGRENRQKAAHPISAGAKTPSPGSCGLRSLKAAERAAAMIQSCQLRNGRLGNRRNAIGGPIKTPIHITVVSPFPNGRAPTIAPHTAAPSIPHHSRVDGKSLKTKPHTNGTLGFDDPSQKKQSHCCKLFKSG